jgi:ATP-binding cassette subfamily F protein 3
MAIVTAASLSKHLGGRRLFTDVSFRVERGERLTLAGRNGSGKTTLLRILAGQISLDGGTLSYAKGARVALHDQRPPRERGLTLEEYALSGLDWVLEIERELRELEVRMQQDPSERVLAAYADAQARLEAAGGYGWREAAERALRGLGFGPDELGRPLATFSGGELTRASLARALAAKPDLLLLDEPTNHLDLGSLEWLEQYLGELDAAVVLVAHDRWFLESVGTSVLELEGGRGRYFSGPWHAWRQEKLSRELAVERDLARREADIARLERFVERFRAKATKARQAKSKQKQIERLCAGAPERAPTDGAALSFRFGKAERSGRVVLELEDGRLVAGERTLLEGGELWLERGEHVCLIGPNGAGKSTLVAALAGRRRLDSGRLRLGHNVKLGYLPQHPEVPPEPGLTALAHAQRQTGLSEARTRALLGRFLFSGEEAEKHVADLSGGELQRLSLALLVASDANLLILDEPTNHLDVESREALEEALGEFDGTLLLISHDRALLEAVGTRTVVFVDRALRTYPGGWAEYREAEERRREAEREARPPKPKRTDRGPEARRRRARERAAAAEERRLERQVEEAERALRELEDELADPDIWSDPERAEEAARRHAEAKRRVEELYERWERVAG